MRAAAKAVSGPALLLLLYVGFYWRLTLTHQFTWLDGPDTAYQIVPWIETQARAFHNHQLPLWDPYEWGGQSLIGQMQPGAAYPLNWILFALPLKNGFVRVVFLHWYFVLIHYLGGLFCYLLCRDLRLGRFASLLGGLTFGVTGWMGGTDWPQMLNGAIWAPLILLFLLRSLPVGSPVRAAGLAGTFLGVSFLSGHHQIPIFLALASGGLLVYLWTIHARLTRWSEALRKTALFGFTAALVSGLATVPTLEYGRHSLRWVGAQIPIGWRTAVPYPVHEQFSLSPLALLDALIPHPWAETRIFVGWVVLALALLAVCTAWRDRAVRVFAFVGLGGLIFALGGNSIYHGLAYLLIPTVEKARSPEMATFLFDFAACVLAAHGAQIVWSGPLPYLSLRRIHRFLYGAAAALAILAASSKGSPPLALGAFSALLGAIVLHALCLGALRPRPAAVLLFLLAIFELSGVTGNRFQPRDRPNGPFARLSENRDVAAFLRSRSGLPRVEIDRDLIPYNFGDWYGLEAFEQYTASVPENVSRIAGDDWARMLLSPRYSIGTKPRRPNARLAFSGRGGVNVYENPDAFPRVWTVHKTVDHVPPTLEELRAAAFLPQPQPLVVCPGADAVSLIAKTMNTVLIDAQMSCQGMVVASEVFAPGWRAYIDGRPAKIWPAYSFLRGVIVPEGAHRIEMVYRPTSVILGAAMTLFGLALSLWLAVPRWLR